MLRPLVLVTLAALSAVPLSYAGHGVHGPDGITARIAFPGSTADLLLDSSNGVYTVEVEIFRLLEPGWTRVSLWSSLRVFSVDPQTQTESSHVSQPFRSSANGPVRMTFPADAVPPGSFLDVFVTFSSLEGSPVPTSHHNLAKNAAIQEGAYDVADALDFHGTTRVLSE